MESYLQANVQREPSNADCLHVSLFRPVSLQLTDLTLLLIMISSSIVLFSSQQQRDPAGISDD